MNRTSALVLTAGLALAGAGTAHAASGTPATEPVPLPTPVTSWNDLPATGLDCDRIGNGGQTEVFETVRAGALTLVTRACLVGTGSAPEVVQVYRGHQPGTASLVQVLLTEEDGATSVQPVAQGRQLRLTGSVRLPEDPGCCPSGVLDRTYRFTGGAYAPV